MIYSYNIAVSKCVFPSFLLTSLKDLCKLQNAEEKRGKVIQINKLQHVTCNNFLFHIVLLINKQKQFKKPVNLFPIYKCTGVSTGGLVGSFFKSPSHSMHSFLCV